MGSAQGPRLEEYNDPDLCLSDEGSNDGAVQGGGFVAAITTSRLSAMRTSAGNEQAVRLPIGSRHDDAGDEGSLKTSNDATESRVMLIEDAEGN